MVLDAGCWMLDPGCWMLDPGCWMLDPGCWMLDAGCWIICEFIGTETRERILNTGTMAEIDIDYFI